MGWTRVRTISEPIIIRERKIWTAHKVLRIYDKLRNKTKRPSSFKENHHSQIDEISITHSLGCSSESIYAYPKSTKVSETSHVMDSPSVQVPTIEGTQKLRRKNIIMKSQHPKRRDKLSINLKTNIVFIIFCCLTYEYLSNHVAQPGSSLNNGFLVPALILKAEASLIIGDSAIEIQEVVGPNESKDPLNQHLENQPLQSQDDQPNQIIFGSSSGAITSLDSHLIQVEHRDHPKRPSLIQMPAPLPPLDSDPFKKVREDITDGDRKSRNNHDYDINEFNLSEKQSEKKALNEILSARPVQPPQHHGHNQLQQQQQQQQQPPQKLQQAQSNQNDLANEKSIAGKVVDFELTPAGGHNKAKIKKKKKKKKEEEMYKKWGKKKMAEKKALDLEHKEHMKKKKSEGHKGKKKWGKEVHGMKKKGKFKKKKWGKKVKKGKGIKKGRKGKKFLKDVGHKNTGFKTVYHKEEWGGSSKWHDIKRQKKWDQKDKKWKKKWNKEKGKKYKGDHMKKFEKKKKAGKKYKKENNDKYKKYKKEKFEKGKKKKMEEKGKKKEGGSKKEMKSMKKKKKKGG